MLCPCYHSLDVGSEVKMARFGGGIMRMLHKEGPCGLELCPERDGTWKGKERMELQRELPEAHSNMVAA